MIARRASSAQGDLSTRFESRGSLIHEPSTKAVHDPRRRRFPAPQAEVARAARELDRGRGAYPMRRRNPQIGQLATPERWSSSRWVVQPFVPQ